MTHEKGAPRSAGSAPSEWSGRPVPSVTPHAAGSSTLAELDVLAEQVAGAFVLVVHVTGGRYRRRCFLTAASAQRAADRALARGENATVYLAELRPLYRLIGGEAA